MTGLDPDASLPLYLAQHILFFLENLLKMLNISKSKLSLAMFSGLLLLSTSCAQSGQHSVDQVSDAATQAVNPVLANSASERIRTDVTWLADDARLGREAGTEAYVEAAEYFANRLENLGVAPGSNGSYFQNVDLRITKRDDDAAYAAITRSDGTVQELISKQDYIGGRSAQGEKFDVTAPLVFAGYGVKTQNHNDYDGLDVDGKIVVVFNGVPAGMNSETASHFRRGTTKASIAAEKGAVGMITLSANTRNPEEAWTRATSFPDNGRWTWVGPDGYANSASRSIAPTFAMGPSGAAALFEGAGKSFADLRSIAAGEVEGKSLQGFDMPGKITLKGGGIIEDLDSPNVVGIIEGSDPVLRDEVVVLSAHLDHVGVSEPRDGGDDHIHNGALDNAMGISTMLEVANRFRSEGAPRRTVVFLAVTAEEKGLIGSDYFANFPTVDADKIVANVNLDMPLVLYPFTDVIAFGAERSSLGQTVRDAAANTDVEIIADPWPNLNLFVRSDHYNFVKQGIPSVFLFLGTGNGGEEIFNNFMRTNYHRPSDQVDLDIHWDDAARFANLNYLIAREISDADEAPQWNEGDFFGELYGK